MLELRIAIGYEPSLRDAAAEVALRHTRRFEHLVSAMSEDDVGAGLADAMARRVETTDPQLRDLLDAHAMMVSPGMRGPRERSAAALIRALNLEIEPCLERSACIVELAAHGEALAAHHPRSSLGSQLIAQAHIFAGETDLARALLSEECRLPDDGEGCMQLSLAVATDEGLPDLVDKYTSRSCTSKTACANAWELAGRTFASRRLWSQAHGCAKRAAQQEPTRARWSKAADYAESGRLYTLAIDSLTNARLYDGGDNAELDQRIASLRARAP
jgi:hypothetical protein